MKRIIIEIRNKQLLSNCNEIVVKVRKESITQDKQQVFFSRYMQEQIDNWEEKKHYRTVATYLSTKNSFMAFRNNQDIPFSQIDKRVIENYENYLLSKGIIKNSSSFYMRIMRAVYNRAVEDGLKEDTLQKCLYRYRQDRQAGDATQITM